jgi:hypothetical protein
MSDQHVTLVEADPADFKTFKAELQQAFAIAVIEEFGSLPDGPIPSDKVLDGAAAVPGAVVLRILSGGREVGGAVLTIDATTHRNSLDLFFIKVGEHGRGLGLQAWQAIERRYPETVAWQTHTPYFEKRNIHFYVNKCGFRIVEFFNRYHSDPHQPDGEDDLPGDGDAFQFEKVMKSSGPTSDPA